MTTKKHPGGRPSKFGSIDLNQLCKLAELGLTDKEMAYALGICEDTFNEYKKNPKFSESLRRGKVVSDEKVERALFERATGYAHEAEEIFCSAGEVIRAKTTKQYPPDTTAAIFWLKNRKSANWKDKRVFEGDKENPVVVNLVGSDANL